MLGEKGRCAVWQRQGSEGQRPRRGRKQSGRVSDGQSPLHLTESENVVQGPKDHESGRIESPVRTAGKKLQCKSDNGTRHEKGSLRRRESSRGLETVRMYSQQSQILVRGGPWEQVLLHVDLTHQHGHTWISVRVAQGAERIQDRGGGEGLEMK